MLASPIHSPNVAEIAMQGHGVVTSDQLRMAGYSKQEIRTMVDKAYLHRVRRGVYVVGHLALGDDARRMLAVRCAGDGAALTQFSAGRSWELTRRVDHVVDVVVPKQRRAVDGARLHVDARLPNDAFGTFRNVPIMSPTWTIVSLGSRLGPGDMTRVLREASYRQILDLSALVRICDGDEHRPGIPVLRKAIDLRMSGSAGYASRLERDLNRYVRGHAVVAPLPNVMIAGRLDEYEVDMVWRALRICCEIDGPIHDDPDVRRDDRKRTADLEAAGWIVIRIHWTEWERDPAGAVARLLDLVEIRAGDLKRRGVADACCS